MRAFDPRWVFAGMLGLLGCASARPLVPLQQGQWAVDLALPALFIEPGIGVPNAIVGGRYGITEGTEARVSLQPAHLLLDAPILVLGGGGIWHVSAADKAIPALHFTADVTLFAPLTDRSSPAAIRASGTAS